MSETENNGGKSKDTRFKPGNPGKPKGARHKKTMLMEKMLADDGQAVVQAVIDAAKNGDMQAAKMVVDRILPAPKGRKIDLDLPNIRTAADLPELQEAIMSAVAAGQITPDEGSTLAGMAEMRRRSIETMQLEERIAALEAKKK
jgi:hypothetical protein